MTIGYVFKAQYFLPYNESHLYPTRFEKRSIDDSRFNLMTDELTNSAKGGYTQILDDFELPINDNVRWSIYKLLGSQLQKYFNVNGMECIQMYICESSQSPFSYESGLLGEILHILLV